MKNRISLVVFTFLFAITTNAQEVPQVQKSLITKVTASWCINCGTWGWSLFEGLVEDNSDKALVIADHYSGDLVNPTAEAFADNFNVFSQPRFILNNVDQNATSNSADSKRTDIKAQVDANFALNPLANAGISSTLNGDMLTVDTKTRFFQSTTGEYYLGVYIIEDGVINYQSGQGSDAFHKNVLRASMSSDPFGELIMNGSIGMNMEFDQQFSLMLDSGWNKDALTIATIIWKKENDNYSFINTNYKPLSGSPSAINEIPAGQLTMNVLPTVSTGSASIVLEVVKQQSNLNIEVLNQQGQLVQSVFDGPLAAGRHTFLIDNKLPSGSYLVKAGAGSGVLIRHYYIQ